MGQGDTAEGGPAGGDKAGGDRGGGDVVQEAFGGPQVCSIVGITYRQLDYWARTGLVRPSIADARGSGSKRRYAYRDLLELKVIKNLLDAGVALRSARKAVEYVRHSLGTDIASANLVIDGKHSVLARTGEEIIDLLRQGQGVLNIVPLAGVKDEVDTAIVELRRPSAGRAERGGPAAAAAR
ncbi:MAG: MerR family transcriptional regulator [Acidimicrobiales bacterium]